MIDVPTLFILGAGAIVPYGYPTGKELRKEIVDIFYQEFENLLTNRRDPDRLKEFYYNEQELKKHMIL